MKKFFKWFAILFGAFVLLLGVAYGWATHQASALRGRTLTAHEANFEIPYPASPAGSEGSQMEQAVERGRHLVQARYACVECHGDNFGGGVMVDDPAFGTFLGPNLTLGEGGVTREYTAADWDRAVRHGILPGGQPSSMPSEDYQRMSDQELSDVIAYIRSFPPVDHVIEQTVALGPVGTFLMAFGALGFSADTIEHESDHLAEPPDTAPTADFGRHLIGVCTGCHHENLAGGPIAAGDPSWLPAANLTPHGNGLAGWTLEDFKTSLRELKRPDGSDVRMPMSLIQPYAQRMTDVELEAMWIYLQTLEARPTNPE